ncbi:MAG TPA: Gfo/Idh/MocA family oxidoreductase [Chloroflexota bacterium]|nr:Gfo/Idh/MocA family oxidoreductase [Chloroflexota bacterium]
MKRVARIGVIGAGWWAAENHLPILAHRDDVELAGICRLGGEELEQVRARFGVPFATESATELLREIPLDGVLVTSPHAEHYQHARAALEHDCHVLVEKPLATSAADARQLVALARARGREILIPHGWNFRPYTREARRLVRAGAIGPLEHVVCQMASPLRDLLSGEPLREAEGALFRPAASTWADPGRAGGYGWGQLCHALGLLFRVLDEAPREVFAWMGQSPAGVDLYDAIALRFESGATAALSGAGTVPKQRSFQLDLRLFGREGMLLFDVERERLEVSRQDGQETGFEMRPGDGAYTCVEPVERFVEICLGRAVENEAPGEVGLRAVEVLDAAYRSAAEGRAVRVADL